MVSGKEVTEAIKGFVKEASSASPVDKISPADRELIKSEFQAIAEELKDLGLTVQEVRRAGHELWDLVP